MESGHKDNKTWKTFRDKLRLKRTGSAWTSSLTIPTSDIPIPNTNHQENYRFSHCGSFRSQSIGVIHETAHRHDLINTVPMSDPQVPSGRPLFSRGSSMRVAAANDPDDSANVSMPGDGPPSRSFKPQIGRHGSIRNHGDGEEEITRRHPVVTFAEERTLSAREAVAAQEAAEAEAAAAASEEEEEGGEEEDRGETEAAPPPPQPPQQVTMSLMDLLEDYDDYDDDEDEEDSGEDDVSDDGGRGGGGGGGGGGVGDEFKCCVCMVKIKGAAFIPCGHTFCRLCSRELMVQKGHCPACSSFVLEFLEIF